MRKQLGALLYIFGKKVYDQKRANKTILLPIMHLE
jgi:hypothetical protein